MEKHIYMEITSPLSLYIYTANLYAFVPNKTLYDM